jgi:DNA-binding MarR family transcriptional regulator
MTDEEFDVLDELYFLQSFDDLAKSVNFSTKELKDILRALIKKGWLRFYVNPSDEISFEAKRFEKDYHKYYYLASKEGLLAHNSNF